MPDPAAPIDPSELRRRLDASRRELLDLSTRNRLLHTPRRQTRSSSVEIVGENSTHIHQMLVIDGKAMTFEAGPENSKVVALENAPTSAPEQAKSQATAEPGETAAGVESAQAFSDVDGDPLPPIEPAPTLAQPVEDAEEVETAAKRLRDDRLQTALPTKQLQQRLLRTYYAARTFEEEQGVNVLYLALGFLKWYEADKPGKERFAPLLLVPVELQRQSVASRFRIAWSGDDLTTNLSLQVKLKSEYRIELPEVDSALDEHEDVSPKAYFDRVRQAVAGMQGGSQKWEVLDDDIVLGFFSFSKLLMYRDLDPAAWPEQRALHAQPLIGGLLGAGAGFNDEPPICGEHELIDGVVDPRDSAIVVDADSSQVIVVEEAKRGRNLVIQGPPGTGKSQTIANIIAAAVKSGKRVLFVAEKVAALNVVKDRLTNIGLGDMCLALHSNKARKAAVLEDVGRTLALEKPVVKAAEQTAGDLQQARDRLNAHALALHTPLPPSNVTAWQSVGELSRLRAAGVPTLDFTLDGCETWTPEQSQQRRVMLKELAAFAGELGVPAQHPWRGAMIDSILPMDLDRLRTKFEPAATTARTAHAAAMQLAQSMGVSADPASMSLGRARGLARAAERIANAPEMDRSALADSVWESNRTEFAQVVAAGAQMAATRARFAATLTDAAWQTDFTNARRDMAAHGDGLFRFLSSAYRNAKNTLRGVLAAGATLPGALADRLAMMDAVMAVQTAQKSIVASNEIGRRAFGSMWLGEKSNWSALAEIERWEADSRADAQMPADFRQIASHISNTQPLAVAAKQTLSACDRAQSAVSEVFAALQLDVPAAFAIRSDGAMSNAPLESVPLAALADRLDVWRGNSEGLTKWIAYHTRDAACRAANLVELSDRLFDGRITPAQALDRFDAARFERLLRALAKVHPMLTNFDGQSHERLQQRFRELDQQRIALARAEVALAHWEKVPRGMVGGVIGEVGVIRRELAKKRRHLPIRQLIKAAGNAVQAIKPVFMMSPMSIAQYIEPGALVFDILLIDEASQVRPVDALGAIARAKQIIVVGDDKQLPPTRFFSREFEGEGDDEPLDGDGGGGGGGSATSDLESILGLCGARNLPQRMLRWHYRSRHHSLIAVSNREFYDNHLYVIPSPMERDATRGLVFHHVRDGVFDRGATATNRVEALAVAEAVMRHAREWPKLSLGVGAFSVQQRDAVIDELERLRRAAPELESFFATDVAEPFFVKNLENIQGDERDVIFISVGYARDSKGAMSMNFGPLSNAGGERRLNVLITRAKSRCEVFTSIKSEDIDLNRATGRGPAAFKAFLAYAERGVLEGAGTGGEAGESMEQVLAKSLRDAGWTIDQHVGVAGFFVDLAVRDPQTRGAHILGVECDGPGYAAARSARDRDQTQPFVLGDRGWRLHRVWSLDFFNRPEEQLQRMLAALRGAPAPAAPANGASAGREASRGGEAESFVREAASGVGNRARSESSASIAVAYKEAKFRVPSTREIPELPIGKLAEIIAKIIEIEGPIHGDEIAERLRQLWEASRVGPKMVRAIDAALEWAVRTNVAYREGDFYKQRTDSPVVVRDRSEVESATLRDPAMLPPMEIQLCIRAIIRANLGVSREEAITATARTLGFKATTPPLRETIDRQIADMLKSMMIVEENDRLREKA